MTRELIIAALIGTLGALCLAGGVLGYVGGGEVLHPRLADQEIALTLGVVGVLLLLAEARLIVPILKSMSARAAPVDRDT